MPLFLSKSSNDDAANNNRAYPNPTEGGVSKIRYVGGMCVGKILFPTTQYLTRHLYEENSTWQAKKQCVMSLHKHIFPSLNIAKQHSIYPESLSEIDHRQNVYGHLTVIDDDLYNMFIKYDEILHKYLNRSKMTTWKKSYFSNVLQKSIDELYLWDDVSIPSDVTREIFKLLAVKYLKVSMKAFKFQLQSDLNIKRTAAFRKAILMGTSLENTDAPAAKKPRHSKESTGVPSNSEEQAEVEYLCSGCNVSYSSTPKLQWIQCNTCKKWRHRKCDKGLRSHKLWKKLTTSDDPYTCPNCW